MGMAGLKVAILGAKIAKKWLPRQRPLVAGCRHSVGRPLKPPSITNRLVAIVHTKPVIALLVPKLVAMATSLRPPISAMSSLDSLTRKPTPRIKQRVASCHTAKVISIQSLPALPPTTRGQPSQRWVGGPAPCLVWTCSHSHRLTLLF